MKFEVPTGTDVAALSAGDPSLLESLRRSSLKAYPSERARAIEAGALWHAETGDDGDYLFHVFVDEEPPISLVQYLEDPVTMDVIHVPSGKLRIAGDEYFGGHLSLDDYPHMGGEIELAPGDYSITAWRTEYPDGLLEKEFEQAATLQQLNAKLFAESLGGWAIFATVILSVVGFWIWLRSGLWVLGALVLLPIFMLWRYEGRIRKSEPYQDTIKLLHSIERKYPSIVLVLKRRK